MTEFTNLTYDKFAERAKDPNLSKYEKIGFPDEIRRGLESFIFFNIRDKIKGFNKTRRRVIDIGCGCSELPKMLSELCLTQNNELILIDSPEMLEALGKIPWGTKMAGKFPDLIYELMLNWADIVIAYSVLHHVYAESEIAVWDFLAGATALLDRGGELLVGDLPNLDKRIRHGLPETQETYSFTDAFLLEICRVHRRLGYDAYILSQSAPLPFYQSRDDILIRRI